MAMKLLIILFKMQKIFWIHIKIIIFVIHKLLNSKDFEIKSYLLILIILVPDNKNFYLWRAILTNFKKSTNINYNFWYYTLRHIIYENNYKIYNLHGSVND